jgi:hypothetical protein
MAQLPLSRIAFAVGLTLGASTAPLSAVWAQNAEIAPYIANEQTDQDLAQLDEQNVGPARQQLLAAMQQLRSDQSSGDQQLILSDQLAVIEARQGVINAQLTSDQTRISQAPADVRAMLQARGEVLQAELALGEAQKKLIADRQANDTGHLREDVALVNSARVQSQRARQQWAQVRAQIHNEISPAGAQ